MTTPPVPSIPSAPETRLATVRHGTWYPECGERLAGRLISITGIAYEFAPLRPLPLLRLAVPVETGPVQAHTIVEVHCIPERLLREIEAVRPHEGEELEITTGPVLVDGFLVYTVTAAGRFSTTERWGPVEIDAYCPFGAQPIDATDTAVFHPVTVETDATEALSGMSQANADNPLFRPSPWPREDPK